jgi:hypothetical protein
MSTRNKTSHLNSLVHVRFRVAGKPQFNPPIFVTFRSCPYVLISRRLIVPNGKSFGHEEPLADLDLETLGAGKRDWNLERGKGVLPREQWEPLKNQRPNFSGGLSVLNLVRHFVPLLDYGAQPTTPQGRIKACCVTSARNS